MIYAWNKEMKRQGSASRYSRKGIMDKINKISDQEVEIITSGKGKVTDSDRKKIAKQIDDLYTSFPRQMVDTFHDIYEKEVKRKVNTYIKSQR
jgi:hypothetical protein